ncbi:MAG: glycosyltransferase family 2 protein [Nitrososphaera sp.]|nr:glycosyltransferase family 2 protein [Nitrososphaera sp.]
MLRNRNVAVVIPAYNVMNEIQSTISGIPQFVDFIVVVDDCSTDDTSKAIQEIDDSRLKAIRNAQNQGVGGATVAGFRNALSLGSQIIVKVDGDDQMDTSKMEELIQPLFDTCDYSKANRFIHSNELSRMPKLRLIGNFVLTFLTKVTSGYWNIFDPQNGYFAITRETLEKLDLEKIHKRYFFENDMLVNLNIQGARVCDVSIPARYGDEISSLRITKVMCAFPYLLATRFVHRIYQKYILNNFSVIGFFYMLGLIMMLFGSAFGLYHWVESIATGVVATTGTVMIAVLPIVLGFQLFLQAMVIEIQEGKQ